MWEQNPASGQGIPLRGCLPVFPRSVQGIEAVLREREDAFSRHPMVGIATGSGIHCVQLTIWGCVGLNLMRGIEKLFFESGCQIKCQHILAGSSCILCQAVTGLARSLRQVSQLLWTSSRVTSCLTGEERGGNSCSRFCYATDHIYQISLLAE